MPGYGQLLADQNPGVKLVYLMGGDSLRDLPSWHRPAEFVSACSLIGVMRRPGDTVELAALEKILPGLSSQSVLRGCAAARHRRPRYPGTHRQGETVPLFFAGTGVRIYR